MNGIKPGNATFLQRADEVADLIDAVKSLIIPFIRAADDAVPARTTGRATLNQYGLSNNVLVDLHQPEELVDRLKMSLPAEDGLGKHGLLETIQKLLQLSVNTWDQGFLDKLYSSTNAVGVVSELLLSVLNTNVHVYQVSPALTVVEKTTGRTFAGLFGFNGSHAGGVTIAGGSASNMTSIIIARNTLYPDTKVNGNGNHTFILFTSEHGHYSVEKAAQACGMGSASVWSVPVDDQGCMVPARLYYLIVKAKSEGKTPLYVNATAGTTVMGSYDPFERISSICKDFGLWMHIDGSWGGSAIFSATQRHKLQGSHLADSLTVNPHKMMNVPLTCSFLLGPDMRVFHKANTLPAGYLFHNSGDEDAEIWDLADLTMQCGRRGDSLKLALAWIYYGGAGFGKQIDHAFGLAEYLATRIEQSGHFTLVSANPPPCLQVCFYYTPNGIISTDSNVNTRRTREMARELIPRGFMVDYSSGEKGSFFRVVVNCQTLQGTLDGLIKALEEVGMAVIMSEQTSDLKEM